MPNQNIAHRNMATESVFSPGYASLICSDFKLIRGNTTLTGERRMMYVSNRSATVIGDTVPQFYRKCFAPGQTKITSAFHTENDKTLILSNGYLYRYTTDKIDNTTDLPDNTVEIGSFLQGGTAKDMQVFPAALGGRVVTIPTDKGLLLLHFQEANWILLDQLFINTANGLLYGGDNIGWVRGSNVESSRKGKLLIGSTSSTGAYFETFLELDTLSILGSWDEITLLNKRPGTGEILYDSDGYSGLPSAPKLKSVLVTSSGNTILLAWTQERPDVVSYYDVEVSQDNSPWTAVTRIPSGAIRTYEHQSYNSSYDYRFRVRACNQEGSGPWSNEGSLVKSGKVCQLGSPQGPGTTVQVSPAPFRDQTTTLRTKRDTYSLAMFKTGGTTSWTTVVDPTVTGGTYITCIGDGGNQKVYGDINLATYSLVCIGHKVGEDILPFNFSIDNKTVSVPSGGPVPGWTETILSDTLLPPGAYSFLVEFPSSTIGKQASVSHVSVIPVLPKDTLRGERWFKPDHPCLFFKGQWDKALPPTQEDRIESTLETYFPQNVTTITGDLAYSSSIGGRSILFGVDLSAATDLTIHGSTSGMAPINVRYNGSLLGTASCDYRRPTTLTIPGGRGVVELFGVPTPVGSDFAASLDGWVKVVGSDSTVTLDAGRLKSTDQADGVWSDIQAPSKYLGDLREFYGAQFKWDYFWTSSNTGSTRGGISMSLFTPAGTLMWVGDTPAWQTWTPVTVNLLPQNFKLGGNILTPEAFYAALSNVTKISLASEFNTGYDLFWLDNFRMGF